MKKRVSVLAVVFMLVSSLVLGACSGKDNGKKPSSDSKYIGTWEAVRTELKGEQSSIDELLEEGEQFVIELHADGTAKVFTEVDKVEEGTWTENDKGIHVKAGDTDSDFTADGDTLYTSILGIKLVFEKQ